MRIRSLLPLLLLCYPLVSQADCSNPQARYADISCAITLFSKTDKEMRNVLEEVEKHLNDEEKRSLTESQKSWEISRDQQARESAKEAEGGSLGRLILINKRIDLTEQRTRDLRLRLKR